MSILLWILPSLVAISVIGDYPYVGLVLTALAGMAFGLNAYLDARAVFPPSGSAGNVKDRCRSRLVARYGWLLDLTATALLIFPTRWMLAGFVLVIVSWLLRIWARRRIVRRTPLDLPIRSLVLMVLVSLWASADLATSLVPLGQIVAGVNAFYAIAERVESERDLYSLIGGLITLGVVIALLAPFGVEWNRGKLFALPQIYGHFLQVMPKGIHPNQLAGGLVLVIPIGTVLFLNAPLLWLPERHRRIGRILLGLGLLAMLAMLVLSQSRGGIAAVVIILLAVAVLRGGWWVLGPLLAAAGGFVVFISSRVDWTRFADILFSSDSISGLAGREEVWSRAVYALQDVPFTGIGLGIFARALHVLYPLFLVGPDADVPHAHNLYLQVGVDLGLPGLVAFIAIVTASLLLVSQGYQSARTSGQRDQEALALGLGLSLIAILLHGWVDVVVWDSKPAIMMWLLLGSIASLYRIECENGRSSSRATLPNNSSP